VEVERMEKVGSDPPKPKPIKTKLLFPDEIPNPNTT